MKGWMAAANSCAQGIEFRVERSGELKRMCSGENEFAGLVYTKTLAARRWPE